MLTLLVTLIVSCQTTDPRTITVSDHVTYRRTRSYDAPVVQTTNPGEAYAAIHGSLYRESARRYERAFGVGNYALQMWPEDRRVSVIAYNLSWLALFMTEPPLLDADRFLAAYESNLLGFARARYYAEAAARLGQREDQFYAEQGQRLLTIIDRGYERQNVLVDFLGAQHNAVVRAYIHADPDYVRLALEQLRDIQARHPDWLPEVIEANMQELREVVQSDD